MRVSIITISLNNVNEIEQTVQSVIGQDYKDIEYIIIDGASTDGTLDILNNFATFFSKLISEPDKGIFDAINKGIYAASGEIIGLVHAGDMLFNTGVISNIVKSFENSGADIVYGNTVLVDPVSIDVVKRVCEGGNFIPERFLRGWMPSHSSVFIKKELFQKYGYYRLDMNIAADYELLLRFMYKYRLKSYYYPGLVTIFRVGGISNRNLSSFLRSNIQCYKSWKLNDLKVPFYSIPLKVLRRIPDIIFRKRKLRKYLG